MLPIQESGPHTSSEQHRGADPLYGDIGPPYWNICVSPEFMTMVGGVSPPLVCHVVAWT